MIISQREHSAYFASYLNLSLTFIISRKTAFEIWSATVSLTSAIWLNGPPVFPDHKVFPPGAFKMISTSKFGPFAVILQLAGNRPRWDSVELKVNPVFLI